jgi:ATP-dependent RNA helicase DHX37/DHR1
MTLAQAKKLKSEARLKTMQRLAALAPSTSTSASLLSSASLGQNPLAPTSAKQRADTREDRLVRRGIERIRRRDGVGSGDEGSDSSGGGVQGDGSGEDEGGERSRRGGKGKGKERAKKVGLPWLWSQTGTMAVTTVTTATDVCLGNLEPQPAGNSTAIRFVRLRLV